MSSAGSIISFDSSTLLSYYQSQLTLSAASASNTAASPSSAAAANPLASPSSATAKDAPPWEATPPAQQARDAQTLAITNFVDTSNVPLLSGSAVDTQTEQDNQKLFSLYTAVNNLSYLASMSNRTGMTAGQLAGFNTRFQTGLQQVQSYLNSTTFNNFTLQSGTPSSSVTSSATVPNAAFTYTTRSLSTDTGLANALPNLSASDSFTISVKKGGTTTAVPIDLSQIQGPLSLDNVVNYVNQQLSTAGFSSRLHRVVTSGSINDPTTASYGIEVDPSASETLTLSSAAATPALYVASSSGVATATTTPLTSATGTGSTATTTTAADQTGRLVKLGGLDGTAQSVFSANAASTSGTTTAQASAVDASGNIYVVGNATGDFGNQLNQGTQDVYLTKYDSAGNVQWTKMLGSAGSASGYGVAVDPAGGVVVTGSTTADLTTTAVADGNSDSFVAKYDANGGQTWVKQIQTLNDNQANAVSVDASGNIYIGGQVTGVIGSGQTNSGGASDAYVAKLDAKGNIVYEQQFGTSGSDSVAATATTSDGGLVVASTQNGDAVISKYANGDATAAPVWTQDLGPLQAGGSIGGIAVSGNQIYLSGTTSNTNLTAGGAATVASPSSGGKDAFVFNLTDQGTSATANTVSYVGTGATDSGNAVTVGADGTVYLVGTTTGTFAGQVRHVDGVNNTFVSALASDGSVQWTQQYGGADGQSSGQGVAIDAQGTSVLDALGLPRGQVTINQSVDLTSLTTLRAGDSFQLQIQGSTSRTATVTIDQGETLKSLANKINIELQNAGSASTNYASGGEGLKIQVNPGFSATLIAGPANSDALGRLGIAAGTITNASTTPTPAASTTTSTSKTQTFGLGIPTNMDISTATGAGAVRAQLLSVLSAIQSVYQKTNSPPASASASMTQSSGTASAYLQSQISNYSLAASLLTGSSTTTSSSASTSNGITDITSLLA
jgi:hypothetical protein